MILVDANLLIYAVDSDAPHHARARRWLEDVLSSGEPVGLAWMVLLAFLRVTTRDGILVRPHHSTAALALEAAGIAGGGGAGESGPVDGGGFGAPAPLRHLPVE